MNFGRTIFVPSYSRKPDFDSITSVDDTFEFDCVNCTFRIVGSFSSLCGREFGWRDSYDCESLKKIEEHFGMNIVGKSLDGGWTAVSEGDCEACGSRYLLYAGINEYANSAYKVTLQGISEI